LGLNPEEDEMSFLGTWNRKDRRIGVVRRTGGGDEENALAVLHEEMNSAPTRRKGA